MYLIEHHWELRESLTQVHHFFLMGNFGLKMENLLTALIVHIVVQGAGSA